MISIIENICVEQKNWITHDEMMNVTVIAESTPGPIAINCATYVGYKQKGICGAIAATLGVVLPSFIIIYLISIFLNNFFHLTSGFRIDVRTVIQHPADRRDGYTGQPRDIPDGIRLHQHPCFQHIFSTVVTGNDIGNDFITKISQFSVFVNTDEK